MPSSVHSLSKSSIEKSVQHYSDAIDNFVIGLKNQYEIRVKELQEEARNVKSSLELEQGLLTEIKAELKNIQQVIQQQTSEFNNQFQRSETERTNKYEKEIESYEGKFSTLYESNKNTSDAQ